MRSAEKVTLDIQRLAQKGIDQVSPNLDPTIKDRSLQMIFRQ
jgi:hypothetical protein